MRLSILQYGDPILRAKGKHIEKIDNRIRELAQNMIETMHAANGVGLAAPQVGESLHLTVLDVSQVEDRPSTMKLNGENTDPQSAMPLVLINPEINLGSDRNRSDGIPGARYSTRSRSSQRDSLYRSDELGRQNKFIEQAQATAKRNAARRETSTTRGSRNHALISLASILPLRERRRNVGPVESRTDKVPQDFTDEKYDRGASKKIGRLLWGY